MALHLTLLALLAHAAAAAPWTIPAGCSEYKSDMGDTQAVKGACGTRDTTATRWSGVARICNGWDGANGEKPPAGLCAGCTTTFIGKTSVR